MFYLSLWLVFFIGAFLQIFTKYRMKLLFLIYLILLVAITALRYGLGTDYFSYQYHYYLIPENIVEAFNYDSHMDIGFRFFISLFRKYDLNFYIFTSILSIVTISLYGLTIHKNSKKSLVSLFLLFSLYWLVYINSALRQGIAMAIFIYAFYEFINYKNYIKYILLILVATLFHSVSIVGIIVIIIYKFYKKCFHNKKLNILLILISIFLFIIKGDMILVEIISWIGISISYQSGTANIYAIILRIINVSLMYYCYSLLPKSCKKEEYQFQLYTYFLMVILFIATSNMSMLSRTVDFIMVIEVILLPNLLSSILIKFDKLLLVGIVFLIAGVLFVKDLKADLNQGQYYNKSIFQYPYITLFKREEILNYRPILIGTIE